MGIEQRVVLLVPTAPAPAGNGLAMRAGMLLEALGGAAVHLVVVPVSGSADDCSWASERARSVTVLPPVSTTSAREQVTAALGDPDLRARLEQTAPLPARAALAPPTLADQVVGALPPDAHDATTVLAMRLYLAPLGIHLAHVMGASRAVVDADDDDVALLRTLGDELEADAYERLGRCWLPDATAVLAASSTDARGIAERAGLEHVVVLPNAVSIPAHVPAPPGTARLLFVGNLTYAPNQAAARRLATDVLRGVQAACPSATLELVGDHAGALGDLATIPGVTLTGPVTDVRPHYERADVVVVPLRHGAGTRIKVLEAFAHHRPVVATSTALSGLALDHGEALVAESTDELVAATVGLLTSPERARPMVDAAARLVAERYSLAAVTPIVRSATFGSRAS